MPNQITAKQFYLYGTLIHVYIIVTCITTLSFVPFIISMCMFIHIFSASVYTTMYSLCFFGCHGNCFCALQSVTHVKKVWSVPQSPATPHWLGESPPNEAEVGRFNRVFSSLQSIIPCPPLRSVASLCSVYCSSSSATKSETRGY